MPYAFGRPDPLLPRGPDFVAALGFRRPPRKEDEGTGLQKVNFAW